MSATSRRSEPDASRARDVDHPSPGIAAPRPPHSSEQSSEQPRNRAEHGESIPQVARRRSENLSETKRSWPLGTLAREGLANSRVNPLRTFVLFGALFLSITLVGMQELDQTVRAENAAEADRRAGRDVAALVSPSTDLATIDAASCAAIVDTPGIIRAGAVLARRTVTSTTGVSFPLYTVTPGVLEIFVDAHLDPSVTTTSPTVVLSSALASELSLEPGQYISIRDRTLLVAAVASTDVRDPTLGRAAFAVAAPYGHGTSCLIEGTQGTRTALASLFASVLERQPDATFAPYLSDNDLLRPDSSRTDVLAIFAAAVILVLSLLIRRRFSTAEAALYAAHGCRPLDHWWLALTETAPALFLAATWSAAIVTGLGHSQAASRKALTDGLEGVGGAACTALAIIGLVAAIPYRGSLLSRLKDRT
jgi:hypothetical protein